ncbi:unnamed protein product [Acanthoscelides obtectus]|uniref:Uncharacterized protein n=1 Tax=Acanthoscelides obtectus TaxID=200917 RepID=A0A9P0KJR6_ACAOB|nr:unnamed protein product [Acanthoscelides obtectus]CAK1632450.1 hypothetical protein AOBTE_LOCUS7578 [Acanthoscelides obtectus]
MSRQGASKAFPIPRRTLSRYVDSNRIDKATMGRKPVMTADRERELSGRGRLPVNIKDTSEACF